MNVANFKLVDPGTPAVDNMTAGFASKGVKTDHMVGYSIQAYWNGAAPVGTFQPQASLDGVHWANTPGSQAVNGSPGSLLINVPDIYYNWVRVVYTPTGGSGFMTVLLNEKGKVS